ncbi:MAG: HEAT repeat domain-containing protein, partial [Planctomycetota bacterium]
MEKRNDSVDKAIEALNKERVRAEPPESVVDATLELLKESQEQFEYEEAQKKEQTAEVLRASSRFALLASAAGIAAAIVLCVIFILELTGKPEPVLVKDEQPPSTEIVQQIEVEEEPIVVEEPVEVVTTETLETKLAQISQMADAQDMEGLRRILREGEPDVKLAAAYYLGRMGDLEAMELLEQLVTQLAAEPNQTIIAQQESAES